MDIRFIEKEDMEEFMNKAHERIGREICAGDLLQEMYLEANNAEEHYDYKLYLNIIALWEYVIDNFTEPTDNAPNP